MKQPNSSARFSAFPLSACACAAALLILSACGGGSGSGNSGSDGNGGAAGGNPPVVAKTALVISKTEVAQTHLIPPDGLNWSTANSAPLTLAAQRDALVLLRLGSADAQNPVVEVLKDGVVLARLALTPPAQLPPSEGLDTPYGNDFWSLTLPANLVQPGISLRVSASNYDYSKPVALTVGANTELQMQILPFVLFGANNANTGLNLDSERVLNMDAAAQLRAAATWPASQVRISNHPLGQFVADAIVIPPKAGAAAYVVSSHHEVKGGHLIETSSDLALLMHRANGDGALNRVTYASIIAIDKTIKNSNQLAWIGGGVSWIGSGVGAGANTYGLLLHETGHAMGLGHSASEYNDASGSKFPYIAGSIKGSAWGFNMVTREFRNPLMPPTAPRFTWCRSNNGYQLDEKGRCYRKDPMDDADNGSDPKYPLSMFSDFNTARIQRWIQGQIKVNSASVTGLSSWDSSRAVWVDYTPKTSSYGVDGIKQNLPLSQNVPVHTIVATYSNTATAGASRFYDPVTHQGNLIETIDPMDSTQLSKIFPYSQNGSSPEYMWYCHSSGCDYTLRVTFSDGSQIYRVLKEGFRKYSYPETFDTGVNDPLNGRSQQSWAINIPAKNAAQIRKLELLDTPLVWRLTPAQISSARVVMSSSY
ncbi:M66 family metalloprotease [Undibacterium curvum]|uniref:Dictomallein n=1 Tax=Undibacterium curvum TaxID=2762294 RepID=A0ABR7A8X4_9BURK|nr:M66 family metalloprotease [Undibacterium curvum]MBC3933350.1 peptidase M66 [Undibacterium curvum]